MNYTLITGASSGIGKELAVIAAREKRNLVLVARDKAGLESVRKQIIKLAQNSNLHIEVIALDLSLASSPQKLYEICKMKHLFVNELINNAGFGDYGEFSKSNLKRQLSMIDLNVRSLTELTHLFLGPMLEKGQGNIMNVGSVASFLPGPLMSVYFASKNYVLRFSEALSEELKGSGVSVTCLCPGSTKTGFGKNAHVSDTHSTANPKVTAQQVAEFGWSHMQRGTRVAVHGFGNRVMLQVTKFIPKSLLTKLVQKIQR